MARFDEHDDACVLKKIVEYNALNHHPSATTLRFNCGVPDKRVRASINRLIGAGLIVRVYNPGDARFYGFKVQHDNQAAAKRNIPSDSRAVQ